MKISTLIENTSYHSKYKAEHGLSLYIETENHKILFDFGQTNAFAENAKLLNIDLKEIDIAILSHGHYDHGGGLAYFLKINDQAVVYVNRHAFEPHYSSKYNGLDATLSNHDRIVFTDDYLRIDDELELRTCNNEKLLKPIDSAGLTVEKGNDIIPDTFEHEQYLLIYESNRKIVISGCSHKGIINIVNWFDPTFLIGGFHYKKQIIKEEGNKVIDEAIEILSTYHTVFYTCHCTGKEQYEYMKERMGNQLFYLASGQIINI